MRTCPVLSTGGGERRGPVNGRAAEFCRDEVAGAGRGKRERDGFAGRRQGNFEIPEEWQRGIGLPEMNAKAFRAQIEKRQLRVLNMRAHEAKDRSQGVELQMEGLRQPGGEAARAGEEMAAAVVKRAFVLKRAVNAAQADRFATMLDAAPRRAGKNIEPALRNQWGAKVRTIIRPPG